MFSHTFGSVPTGVVREEFYVELPEKNLLVGSKDKLFSFSLIIALHGHIKDILVIYRNMSQNSGVQSCN